MTWNEVLADNRTLRGKLALVVQWAQASGTDVAGRPLGDTRPATIFLNHVNNIAVLGIEHLDSAFFAAEKPLPWLDPRKDRPEAADLKMLLIERMFLINVVTAMEVMLLDLLPAGIRPELRRNLEASLNRFLTSCVDNGLLDEAEKQCFGFAIGVRNDVVHRDGVARQDLEAVFRGVQFRVHNGTRPEVPTGWFVDIGHMVCLLSGPLINRI